MTDIKGLAARVRAARRVYLIGNGGSFANAQHIQNDLENVGIRAHTLSPASLTRTANDAAYDEVFSAWIALHGEPGDMLIALSGSGTSRNILRAIEKAVQLGMDFHLETNYLRESDMQGSEEAQLVFGHALMRELR